MSSFSLQPALNLRGTVSFGDFSARYGDDVPSGPTIYLLSSGAIDDALSDLTSDTASVVVTGGNNPGTYTAPRHLLENGEAYWLAFDTNTEDAQGVATSNGDGLSIICTNPAPITERIGVRVSNSPMCQKHGAFFEVTGLTDAECAFSHFEWDFDEAGDFSVFSARYDKNKQRGTAHGYQTVMAWEVAGAKNCTLTATFWHNGALVTQVIPFTVDVPDIDAICDATNTFLVDTTGAFTGAPVGQQYTSMMAARTAAESVGGLVRYRLRRDQTISENKGASFVDHRDNDAVIVDDWGTGTKPVLDCSITGGGIASIRAPERTAFINLDFVGDFDPQAGTSGTTGGENITGLELGTQDGLEMRATAYGCRFERTYLALRMSSNAGAMIGMNCEIDGWENMGTYSQGGDEFGYRGMFIKQRLNVVNGNENKNTNDGVNFADHGPGRYSDSLRYVMAQAELGSFNGWTDNNQFNPRAGYETAQKHQSVLRLGTSGSLRSRVLVYDVMGEGGAIDNNASVAGRAEETSLCVIACNYLLASANAGGGVGAGHSGMFVLNNVFVVPNVQQESSNILSMMELTDDFGAGPGWLSKPVVRAHNNTFICLVDASNVSSTSPGTFDETFEWADIAAVGGAFENLNNVYHVAHTLSGEAGPLLPDISMATNAFIGEYEGQRLARTDGAPFDDAVDLDATYATPAGSNVTGKLLATSPHADAMALGTDMPVYDHDSAIRRMTTSQGAFDAAT